MSFQQFIVIPVFIALQAFTMMVVAPSIPGNSAAIGGGGLVTWIAFQAWAMYFLAGCTPKMAMKTLAGYAGGIVASIAIFELHNLLTLLDTASAPWGLYLAVFIVVIFVISAEKVPGLDFIPAYFIGAGVFFGLMTHCAKPTAISMPTWYAQLAVPEIVACVVGLAFGWVTVTFRTKYEAKFTAKASAQ